MSVVEPTPIPSTTVKLMLEVEVVRTERVGTTKKWDSKRTSADIVLNGAMVPAQMGLTQGASGIVQCTWGY